MINNVKKSFSLLYINVIVLVLSISTLKVNAETKIIAKNGDTLLKISRQYGVTLKELMYKNNFNNANSIIEGEVVLIPESIYNNDNEISPLTHKVIEGDTLYKIAKDYSVNLEDIISLNNLDNNSYLKINQIIILPKGAKHDKVINQVDIESASNKVFYHQTSKIEYLSDIAKIHRIPIEEINNLNNLNHPIKINPDIKLKLRERKTKKWIKYGLLMINWSDWTYLDGNYVVQAKTKKNKSFYLALNCEKRTLNNTLKNSYWTSWYFPETDFEFKLINDFCDQSFKT